jgi:type IV pilus assembly protein PilB
MNVKQVLEVFVEQGIVEQSQVADLSQEINQSGKSLSEVMVDYGFCTEDQFYQTIADSVGADYVSLSGFEPPPELLRLLPAGLAQLHRAFPLGLEGHTIQVALADALDSQTSEDLRFALGREIQVVVAPVYQIEDLIKKHYGTDVANMDEILAQLGGELEFRRARRSGRSEESRGRGERHADHPLRGSDHVSGDSGSRVGYSLRAVRGGVQDRYRVDGALYEMSPPPRHLAMPVISRVKVMANLNIAERRLPQDGRIRKSSPAARSICASPHCRRNSVKASCSACSIGRR